MLYSQVFKECYDAAKNMYYGELPIHVRFMLEEFANVNIPNTFPRDLSTMRSRNMSATIIIQNMAQLKTLYEKDKWETIPGNCDTLIYLGGNEQSTHKYISDSMGPATVDKRTLGVTKSKQGSSSINNDNLARTLMLPNEIRKLSRRKCILLISGYDPIVDLKIKTLKHPFIKQTLLGGAPPYEFKTRKSKEEDMSYSEIINKDEIMEVVNRASWDAMKKKEVETGEKICFEIDIYDLISIPDLAIEAYENDVVELFSEEQLLLNRIRIEEEREAEESKKFTLEGLSVEATKTVIKLQNNGFEAEKIKVLLRLIKEDYSYNELVELFPVEMDLKSIKMYTNQLIKSS